MPHETITYGQINKAAVALGILAAGGYDDPDTVEKLAGMAIWAQAKGERFEKARKMLVEGHAKRDGKGNKMAVQQKNADGEMEDIPNTVQLKDQDAFTGAFQRLVDKPVNTNGIKLTDEDLADCRTPQVLVDLGPLYDHDWGIYLDAEEDGEEEPDIAPAKPAKKKGK